MAGVALTALGGAVGPGLVARDARDARDAAALCVAGVGLGDIHLDFTWQAWHNLTSTVVLRGRRLTQSRVTPETWHCALGPGLVARDARDARDATALCMAGVGLGDIHLDFTWQAWHNLTSTVVLRGRRLTHGTGWRPWARFSRA